ncbi:Lipoprotein signal peptidase [Sinobacterium norvegicum]|uniref:Lipoprotein signal peptidase n=2 Tax=Sinobacterium norvegicum TaxID=1641715 RepID=A0ABM9AJ10_9GAMM|nr:signal peptidase II [Sinobacterium norvegicum]CAH0993202.1 Lipoprotein signal peptidase [Sinobacterium norvegicum]
MKWFWFALAAIVIILDQYSKFLASTELAYLRPVEITSWFNLMLAHNEGAAFSFLSDAGGWQRWFFTAIAAIVSVVIAVWLFRLPAQQTWLACSLALILGGAIGNLIDRAMLGYVVDFISVHYGGRYFPAFNIADSGICVGAAMLIIDSFRHSDEATA